MPKIEQKQKKINIKIKIFIYSNRIHTFLLKWLDIFHNNIYFWFFISKKFQENCQKKIFVGTKIFFVLISFLS